MSPLSKGSSKSALFISHGGGPLPLLGDPAHNEMIDLLKKVSTMLAKPSAIIVISAHWEENIPTVTSAQQPSLIYDYSGFPVESYAISYPVPGNPLLAYKIVDLLHKAGMDAGLDEQRGFDHGVFVPLKIMYPEANIPCVQLSLVHHLSPAEHIQIGKALAGLADINVLVMGSGFSFHNMNAFFLPLTHEARSMNESFEQWLIETCTSRQMNEKDRAQRLVQWARAPAARYCHPREEHLLPLHVCYGFAQSPTREAFTFEIMGKKASAYLW